MENTTTTEMVRAFYSCYHPQGMFPIQEEAEAEFDRWLAEVKAQQDKATTDRIIALLEKAQFGFITKLDHSAIKAIRDAIALIKGENK